MVAAQFLRHLIQAAPYKLHTVLTNNGIQRAIRGCDKYATVKRFHDDHQAQLRRLRYRSIANYCNMLWGLLVWINC